jgi:PAS domain S-box-containing protein
METLSEHERLLEAILQSQSSQVLVLDRAGNVTRASHSGESFARLLGRAAIECIGVNYLEACRPAIDRCPGAAAALAGTEAVLAGRTASFSCEYPCECPSESGTGKRWFWMRVDSLTPDIGGAIVKNIDITDRKRAESALAESEARYRSVVESQTALICRYLPDTTLTFVNDAYCRYFGKTRDELVGRRFLELIPDTAREAAQRHVESLIREPRVVREEHEVLLADGRIGWQVWVDHAITAPDGTVLEFQGIGRDITERKQAESAVSESEARYRAFFDLAAAGAATASVTDGRYLSVNDTFCQITGYTREELLGRGFIDITHPDDRDENAGAFDRLVRGEITGFRLEKRYVRKDGEIIWVQVDVSLVRDATGSPLHSVCLIQDITVRRRAEQALRMSEEALRRSRDEIRRLAGRLIRAQEEERRRISRELHDDLNQRLAALAIAVSRVRSGMTEPNGEVARQLTQIQQRIITLTNDVRALSHALHPPALEHAGLVPALESLCAEFAADTGIETELAVADDLSDTSPDIDIALCIYRVAQESLKNTAAHSGTRSAALRLSRMSDAIELSVSDVGRGFDSGESARLRGLGLRSMKERVRLLQGQLHVGRRPGGGTEVRVRLPLRGGTTN